MKSIISSSLFYPSSFPINSSSITTQSSFIQPEITKEIDNIIIQKNINFTKEEIINNISLIMEDYDLGKTYEIFGKDYKIKISKINSNNFKNITTFIDFSNCEKILREENKLDKSDLLIVFQMEIDNPDSQILIDNVKYSIFNEEKQLLDLSVCEKETIEIHYQLNTSMINMTKLSYYLDLGIDIFNIEDDFFNDICYSYSENDSDMILKDRVSDIYENYSVCENNCKYDRVNLTLNTVVCKCSVKTSVDSEIESPKLAQIIRDSFKDSNLAVITCYKLVFNLKGKLKNYGFWIFSVLILLHFPLFIHYFIFNISFIQKYIFSEMMKYNYWYGIDYPPKRKSKEGIKDGKMKNGKIIEIKNQK